MLLPRSAPSEDCWASESSRPRRPATAACWTGWPGSGRSAWTGIEGTGSHGAGLSRHVTAAGVRVVEVDRSDRQDRRRQGKSDPLDAVSAARAAQSGRARGAPKGRDGTVEAIRALMVAKRSARSERTQTINQARALVRTGPDDLRARLARYTPAALVAEMASLRPRPGDVVGYAVRIALRELGRRAEFLDSQLQRLDELIVPLVTAHAPGLLALYGIGPSTAALLLIAAGDHPERLRSEAAWAHLRAAAPIPASSGKTVRHRLNPGGDRQASHALWRIAFTRMGWPGLWWRPGIRCCRSTRSWCPAGAARHARRTTRRTPGSAACSRWTGTPGSGG